MPLPIEDYAVIGDRYTAALVGVDGSIDWLCLPRFDSAACFAALLGDQTHGRWRIAPAGSSRPAGRRYRENSLVLETDLANDEGTVRVIDCMTVTGRSGQVIRIVEGVSGRVRVCSEVNLRFDYGQVTPWLRDDGRAVTAIAGPDSVVLDGDVPHTVADGVATAEFWTEPGEKVALRMTYVGVGDTEPPQLDLTRAVGTTDRWWKGWATNCTYSGPYRDAVVRSLITLKALSYAPSGGMVAAATTSLPESLGGPRNWDYRYCWLRDATFTLLALLHGGYENEAVAWREWLLRALAGDPQRMQIMYGVNGERRLPEQTLDHLPGYAGSQPVRVGNAASEQFQLDVYGELMDALHQARAHGVAPDEDAWRVQRQLMEFLERVWREPDNGIWEMRGPRRHFVQSKVMAWVAADRAVRGVEDFGLDGPVERWRNLRAEIHAEVCERGFDERRGTFTQYYGSASLDAALLVLAPVGFLPADDPRVLGTVAAIEHDLVRDGFVQRYTMNERTREVDNLPPGEGAFLPCTFWLADNYALQGRHADATALYERLLALRNDVGLLSEEYDPKTHRLLGNLPQAFSHVPLVNTAYSLVSDQGPAQRRATPGRTP
ncbi:MAG: glycoside hydrolase family 15 protein [Actinobacteria bacterium]|nr:glycoside hydrolase family 15 protein [Actinomycetota bacterium]